MPNVTVADSLEIWKRVGSLEGVSASSHGRVKRDAFVTSSKKKFQKYQTKPAKVLSGEILQVGYRAIKMRHNGIKKRHLVHRLICEAFHGKPTFDDATVDHIDGNRLNNVPSNLEWVTRSENSRRQNACGRGAPKGEKHPLAKITDEQAASIPHLRRSGISVTEIAISLGVSTALIYKILRGERHVLR